VRGCPRVGVTNADMSLAVEAETAFISDRSDVAILRTKGGPPALALDLDEDDLALGASGFHIGFPQGEPGDVVSRLIGRERLYTEGHWRGVENTLAWAEVNRSEGLRGTLGGLSGGPVFDANGRVLGVTIAESPRRGRVITTAADSVSDAIAQAQLAPQGSAAPAFNPTRFDEQGQRLRSRRQVVRVVCLPEA
jgi:serine protease Do